MKFDKSKIFTCKDAEKTALGSYGYFADSIGELKSRVEKENKDYYGKLQNVLDENKNCRFDGAHAGIKVAWCLFYLDKLPNEADTDFDESKVFTSSTSTELKIHSIGYFANTIRELRRLVESKADSQLSELAVKDKNFFTAKNGRSYIFFYLVEEPKGCSFRPYKDTDEMISHFCKHFGIKYKDYNLPTIWVKRMNNKYLVTRFGKNTVSLCSVDTFFTPTFEYLLENYKYLDGTSCGIKEK